MGQPESPLIFAWSANDFEAVVVGTSLAQTPDDEASGWKAGWAAKVSFAESKA